MPVLPPRGCLVFKFIIHDLFVDFSLGFFSFSASPSRLSYSSVSLWSIFIIFKMNIYMNMSIDIHIYDIYFLMCLSL